VSFETVVFETIRL